MRFWVLIYRNPIVMPTKRITDHLLPGKYYHIYNRGNEKTKIFYKHDNYQHFIRLYKKYLEAWVDTYSYCFIPNHFHLLVYIKDNLSPDLSQLVSQQFRRFFISYAMAINKQQKRKGSLFQRPFRRQIITTNFQLKRTVYYIHNNPVKHNITNDFREFNYSSYHDILINNNEIVDCKSVVSWFNDLDEFIEYHDFLSNPEG